MNVNLKIDRKNLDSLYESIQTIKSKTSKLFFHFKGFEKETLENDEALKILQSISLATSHINSMLIAIDKGKHDAINSVMINL